MPTENGDTTIEDIHRIRREIAAKFNGDLVAMTADAQARTEASGRTIIRRPGVLNERKLLITASAELRRVTAPRLTQIPDDGPSYRGPSYS